MADRRSYGSGSLSVRPDSKGRETYYGTWRSGGRRVKRRLGVKRAQGGPDGLTAAAAEKEMRRQMGLVVPSRAIGARITIQDAGARYVVEAKRRGRKASTLANIESEVRIHL